MTKQDKSHMSKLTKEWHKRKLLNNGMMNRVYYLTSMLINANNDINLNIEKHGH